MSPDQPYEPIACALHDQLEAAATRRKVVTIEHRGSLGEVVRIEDRIEDLLSRDGAEYMILAKGIEVRLDQVVSVEGVAFAPGADG
ncbi:MAG: hypothetical protein OEO79_06880 [Gemmatimonadota bacterium]|nr:hypothetical protein [Gemmatimonadota bacterium]MDH3421840.1 hypothetical protein [Gemmatimonadota bacterium]